MKTLLLIDGSSYLYRAFHALPDLRNRDDQATGAIHGVLNMLERLRNEIHFDFIACIFDSKGKTFRHKLYPQYKANRPPMPEDLVTQINPLNECIRAMGIPLIFADKVEADDVIGTLTRLATDQGIAVKISTGDKDIAQLVNSSVMIINTMSNEILDEAGVKTKFGVKPQQIIDYLTLIGDKSDNIPGVEKVGPKTAIKWLKEYDDLDTIIKHSEKIPGKVGENLRNTISWLPRAKELITIKKDVNVEESNVSNLKLGSMNKIALGKLFSALQIRFLDTLSKSNGTAWGTSVTPINNKSEKPEIKKNYITIYLKKTLIEWRNKASSAKLVSIDTETTSLNPIDARLVGISMSTEPGEAAYIPCAHNYNGAPKQLSLDSVLSVLQPILENENILKVGQNIKYDKHVFANYGIQLRGIAHDTLLQSYVLESHHSHGLGNLARRHLQINTTSYEEVAGKGKDQLSFDCVPIPTAAHYASEDADVTLQLHSELHPKISKVKSLLAIYKIEIQLLSVLFDIERNGVKIDSELLETQSKLLTKEIESVESNAYQIAQETFNIGSTKQLRKILFEKLAIKPIKKTPKGLPSTDEEVLQKLALDYPLPKLILKYRSLTKLKTTYTDKLPLMVNKKTSRIHTNYGQAVAVTGRLTSNEPNLQNIPVRTLEGRAIRKAFIPEEGAVIISADYSQIELRIMAHLSKDKTLLKAFKSGDDIHRHTASEIFSIQLQAVTTEQRRFAKIINFGLIYGMGSYRLAKQLDIEYSEAQAYIETYFSRYPGVKQFMSDTQNRALKEGYVETVFGRRLYLPEIRSNNHSRRTAAQREAINAPMQGTAADLIKLAMINTNSWIQRKELKSKIIMQVHDELVLEVPTVEKNLVESNLPMLMGEVASLDVPLVVEIGTGLNWEEAH